ncbi:hypothetical protein SO802_005583 [Lithocarpus litseifolius]|uniref:Cation/H+ exchanger transmembrane domain-containing protein n=1 Tax=Lithocarpus litseifolius TaxID=425828 RepID=A0AAW2DME7_9ROSI
MIGVSRFQDIVTTGAPPPRKVVVQQRIRDKGVLEAICDFVVEALGSITTVEDDVVKRILPFIVSGLQPGTKGGSDHKLFEMGLELSFARLKALVKFAFGMGLTQVVLSTLAFTAFELPPNGAIGTKNLEFLFHSRSDLVNIRSIDEVVVIGAALSLFFSFCSAEGRSSEGFVALCLLTVAGTSFLTQMLGFSDTLGAFLVGALLAETNFRTQIEADIRPFRGLLLGLFFVTTGTSIDMQLLIREWPNVLSLLAGLIVIKTLIITAIGPRVGLTVQESVRIGLLLSQGGEFGFVVFSLANRVFCLLGTRLGVLPLELNKLLIIVVVLSMALTLLLNDAGRRAAEFIGDNFDEENICSYLRASANGLIYREIMFSINVVGLSLHMTTKIGCNLDAIHVADLVILD